MARFLLTRNLLYFSFLFDQQLNIELTFIYSRSKLHFHAIYVEFKPHYTLIKLLLEINRLNFIPFLLSLFIFHFFRKLYLVILS